MTEAASKSTADRQRQKDGDDRGRERRGPEPENDGQTFASAGVAALLRHANDHPEEPGLRPLVASRLRALQASHGNQYVQRMMRGVIERRREEVSSATDSGVEVAEGQRMPAQDRAALEPPERGLTIARAREDEKKKPAGEPPGAGGAAVAEATPEGAASGPGESKAESPTPEESESSKAALAEAEGAGEGAAAAATTETGEGRSPEAAAEGAKAEEKVKGEAEGGGGKAAEGAAPSAEKSGAPEAPATGPAAPAGGGPAGGGPAGGGPAEEKGPAAAGGSSPASPENDPAFQAVAKRTKGVAVKERSHAPSASESAKAQAAAVGPPDEVASQAAAGHVDVIDQQQPRPFNRAAFKAALKKKIADTTPKNLEEADEFKSRDKLSSVKADVAGKVSEGKEQAQGAIKEKTAEAPKTSGTKPKPVTPLKAPAVGPAPPDVGAAGAAPKPKTKAEVEAPFKEGSKKLDDQMTKGGVTEEQIAQSNEPEFTSALASKKEAQADAAKAPGAYREHEGGVLSEARAEAEGAAQDKTAAMHGERGALLAQVGGSQTKAKSEDEKKRAEVSKHINGIFENTKKKVEGRLEKLDGDVGSTFDKGADAAKKTFENFVDGKMRAYKKKRYSGLLGKGRWLKDKLFDMPSAVNAFYAQGRDLYIAKMDGVLDRVVDVVEKGLADAKRIVAQGRQEIQKYVSGLPKSLQQVGKDASGEIQGKFDALDQSVNDKQGELIDSLAKKYNDNLGQIDSRIEELKEANKGLVSKAVDAVAGVVKTIIKLKDMLLNTLSRASSVITMIIEAPIKFLGNLISGVKKGFDSFVGNIGKHLKSGLLKWLTGAVGSAGIKMPDTFDLPGIFSLVTQILGLTYANVRKLLVKGLGEKVVAALEKSFDILKTFATKGVGGLWELVKDKIGDLKSMVMDKIEDLLITKVVTAGIKWIIGLLNPAAAFIKACMAIYSIVKFIITRGKEILALVNAFIDSVIAVAKGQIGGAAKLIENSLAKAVPLVIGFLASLLGVGGLGAEVRKIIQAVQAPINKAIFWVIGKAKKAGKKLMATKAFSKAKAAYGKAKAGYETAKGKAKAAYAGAMGKAKGAYSRAKGKITGKGKGAKPGEPAAPGAEGEKTPEGAPLSKDLVTEVEAKVSEKTKEPFADEGEARRALRPVFQQFRPKGLTALDIVKSKTSDAQHTVVARAVAGHLSVGSATLDSTAKKAIHNDLVASRPNPKVYAGQPGKSWIRGYGGREWDCQSATRKKVDNIGYSEGCHSCGAKAPGTKDPCPKDPTHKAHWIPDHQPPLEVQQSGAKPVFFRFYAHCLPCARVQAVEIRHYNSRMKKLVGEKDTQVASGKKLWGEGVSDVYKWFWS